MRSPRTARQVLDKISREHPELVLAAKDVDMSLVAIKTATMRPRDRVMLPILLALLEKRNL